MSLNLIRLHHNLSVTGLLTKNGHDNVRKCNSARKYDQFSTKVLIFEHQGVTVDSVTGVSSTTFSVDVGWVCVCVQPTEIPYPEKARRMISLLLRTDYLQVLFLDSWELHQRLFQSSWLGLL